MHTSTPPHGVIRYSGHTIIKVRPVSCLVALCVFSGVSLVAGTPEEHVQQQGTPPRTVYTYASPQKDVSAGLQISRGLSGLQGSVILDQRDDRTGFQIQMVYVETLSAVGGGYDVDAPSIREWVSQGQRWLQFNAGKQLIYDTYNGDLDVLYMRIDFDLFKDSDTGYKLLDLYNAANPNSLWKIKVFVINQTANPSERRGLCGWAAKDTYFAVVFPWQDRCDDDDYFYELNNGLSYPAASILHELVHSFGVGHVCVDTTDVMIGSPECPGLTDWSKPQTFDVSRSQYYGASAPGNVDLNSLKIWTDGTGTRRPTAALRRGLYEPAFCWKGEPCILTKTSFKYKALLHLQVKKGNTWKTVAKYRARDNKVNTQESYRWEYSVAYSPPISGKLTYRLYIPPSAGFSAYIGPSKTVRVVK